MWTIIIMFFFVRIIFLFFEKTSYSCVDQWYNIVSAERKVVGSIPREHMY